MTSQVFAVRNGQALIVGLNWRLIMGKGGARKRQTLADVGEMGARRMASVSRGERYAIGGDVEDVDPFDEADGDGGGGLEAPVGKIRQRHSLAVAVGRMFPNENVVCALTMRGRTQAVVIVVEAGVPLQDNVRSIEEAQSEASSHAAAHTGWEYRVVTNDLGTFQFGDLIDEDQFWEQVDSATQIRRVPINATGMAVGLAVTLALGAAVVFVQDYRAEQERQARLAAQRAADPLPKYRAALPLALSSLGLNADGMREVLLALGAQPLWQVGWRLEQVSCLAQEALACRTKWVRDGGTTDRLQAARAAAGEEIESDGAASLAFLRLPINVALSGIPDSDLQQLPDAATTRVASTPIFQTWDTKVGTSGVMLQLEPAESRWPEVSGVNLNSLPAGEVVLVRKLAVAGPLPSMLDVLATAPKNIWWRALNIKLVAGGSEANAVMTVSIEGAQYAK